MRKIVKLKPNIGGQRQSSIFQIFFYFETHAIYDVRTSKLWKGSVDFIDFQEIFKACHLQYTQKIYTV